MTQLRIENQNSNIEIVNVAIIQKLYETALNASGTVYLKGNLQSDHAKQSALTYLNDSTRFPDFHITVPVGAEYADIQDSAFEQACILYWGDGFGVTTSAVQNITKLEGWYFSSRSSTLNNANFDITTINTINLSGFTNLTEIGASVFSGCTNLRNIILPSGLKRLSYDDGSSSFAGCFRSCSHLSSIQLPNGLEELGDRCFMNCSSLTSIQFPQTLKYIGGGPSGSTQEGGVFFGCGLASVTFPNSLQAIEWGAFRGCPLTGTITIPESVQRIGDAAFSDNAGGCIFILEEGSQPLTLPEHNMANHQPHLSLFTSNSNNPNAVIFKRTISQCGKDSLMMHSNIKYLFKQTTPPTVASGTELTFSWKTSGTIYVEDAYVNTWKAAPGFSDIPDLIQPLSTAPSDLRALLNATSS